MYSVLYLVKTRYNFEKKNIYIYPILFKSVNCFTRYLATNEKILNF